MPLTLRGSFLAWAVPVTAALVTLFLVGSFFGLRARARIEIERRGALMAEGVAAAEVVQSSLREGNPMTMRAALQATAEADPDVEYLVVRAAKGEELFRYHRGAEGEHGADLPTLHQGERNAAFTVLVTREQAVRDVRVADQPPVLGTVQVGVNGTRAFHNTLFPMLGAGLTIPLALFAVVFMVLRRVYQRVARLVEFTQAVARGDLSRQLAADADDELGQLAGALNAMNRSLGSIVARAARVTEQLTQVVARLTDSATDMTSGAESQHSAVQETRSELDEMAHSQRATAQHVESINRSARQSADDARNIGERNAAVRRDLDRLGGAVDSLTSSVEQVGGNITIMARQVDVLSQATGETVSAISRTEEALRSVGSLTGSSSAIAEQVVGEARSGSKALGGALEAITTLEGAMGEVRRATATLTDRVGLISVLLQAIADVARRTNLLSLNASIISAQAGEHGRQFQIVADEVKALAGQVTELTHDIERALGEVASAGSAANGAVAGASQTVARGVAQTREAGTVLDRILEATAQSAVMTQEIASSMGEREGDASRIKGAMEKVSTVTGEIQSVTRTQVAAADLMRDAAGTIATVVTSASQSAEQQYSGSQRIVAALSDVAQNVGQLATTQGELAAAGERVLGNVEAVSGVADRSRSEARALEQALAILENQVSELKAELQRFVLESISSHSGLR